MRTLVVSFSKFGNTRRLAEAIAEVLQRAGDTRTVSIDRLVASDLAGANLIVMGTPTHGFTVPQGVRDVLEKLPPKVLTGKAVAAFDTTVKAWPLRRLRASPKLLDQLRRLGGKPIVPPETFYVRARNPQKAGEIDLLHEGELEHAREWASRVLEQAKT